MNVADLLTAASTATPDIKPHSNRWAILYPVFLQLRAKGFTRRDAVDWLAKQGALSAEDSGKATKAFDLLAYRRKTNAAKP